MEHSIKPNGFKPKSYGDLVAIASLMAMFMSVVMWGLKLEARNDFLHEQISEIKVQISNGILPRAEERLHDVEDDVDKILKHIAGHEH